MRIWFLITALAGCLASPPATAQDLRDVMQLASLAQQDPAAALRQAQAWVDDPQDLHPREVFDLLRFVAEGHADQGNTAQAATALERAATFAVTRRALVDVDPAPLWEEAARQYEAAGDPEGALRAWRGVLREQRAGGLAPEAMAVTLQRMAALADRLGRSDDAADLRARASELLRPTPEALDVPAPGAAAPLTRGTATPQAEVELFYATDRARSGRSSPPAFYGTRRAAALELGVLTVTIPPTHRPGIMDRPRIWRLEFKADPAKHMVLKRIEPLETDAYFARMRGAVERTDAKEAFVYVHGFNIPFEKGARRAAQMAFDMEFDGVPILYSWPSRGSVLGYVADSAAVRHSARRLTHFLNEVRLRSGATTVHLVAHSMGARAMTDALELMALREGIAEQDAPLFGQLLFAAPDIDSGLFRAMLPTIRPLAQRVTVYASERDWALVASRKLHGSAARAGLGGRFALSDPLMDSVDMTALGEDMLAHNYFADGSSALADMMTLFWRDLNPEARCGLQPRDTSDTPIWDYQIGQCEDAWLMAALAKLRKANAQTPAAVRQVLQSAVSDPARAQALERVVLSLIFP